MLQNPPTALAQSVCIHRKPNDSYSDQIFSLSLLICKVMWEFQTFCRAFGSEIVYVDFFSVAQQSNSGLDRLIVEVYRSHTTRRTHPVGLLWTSDQPVAEAATNITHNKHKRQASMPSVGFEPAIPSDKRPPTYGFDRTANGFGN